MTETVWRIATDTSTYQADDLTGAGAEKTGGRWNTKGLPVLYTSRSRALACLETFVHLNANGLPLNRYLVRIDIPDSVWGAAQIASPPIGWDAEPAGIVSLQLGSNWLKAKGSAVLRLPSVIVPEEENILINPLHDDAVTLSASKVRKWLYDPRMVKVQ